MDLQKSLQRAFDHLQAGVPAQCVKTCNDVLAESPGLIQALFLRGCAAYQTGDLARSVDDLQIVYNNYPQHRHAAYNLGRALRTAGRFDDALAPLESAIGEDELAVPARYELAVCLTRLRRRPEAIEHYRAILKRMPENLQVAANLASLLERENRLEEAVHWVCRSLELDPDNETALMTRATLDRRTGKIAEAITGLRSLIKRIDNPVNRSIAWNQLGQCHESREEWDDAYNAFSESNHILRELGPASNPDPQGPHSLTTLARIHDWLKSRPLAAWNEYPTDNGSKLAFLVGFPRSGTTLLDRMLGQHPDIEVLEEKSLFSSLHQDWSIPGTLEALSRIHEAQVRDAQEIYRQAMSRHRRHPQRSLVIDKLPLNLAYLFLIHRLFPTAPVIFLKRHPMDVCLSCYFQAFELEASMAYFLQIEQTARYYDAVMQVAMQSMEQIRNPLHELRYEQLVAEPKSILESLLKFLGFELHESMLDYQRWGKAEASNTPSYQQVSQPAHTRSVGKWTNYAKQLEPVSALLAPWVKRLGYQ